MRILFACGDFYPNLGGATSLFDDMAQVLLRDGHEVTVVTRRWPGFRAAEVFKGYEIVRLDYPVLFERLIFHRQLILRSPGILAALRDLITRRRIETVCIGLLDISALYLLLLKPLLGFKLVLYLHGSDTRRLPQNFDSYRFTLKLALRAAEVVIPVSAELAEEAARLVPSARKKMRITPNGVDVEALRATAPFLHTRPYIAFVGRLVHEKDVDTLIDAFELAAPRMEGIDLLIAGTGREGPRLGKKAAQGPAAARIHFLGLLSREQCWAVIRGALFVALPSRSEGHPIVGIEARTAGKPLFGSDIPAIARLVDHGRTGILFPQGDAAALAGHMEKYCSDRGALEELTTGALHADYSEFDIGSRLDQLLSAFK